MYIWAATAALFSSGIISSAEKNNKTYKIKLTFNQKKIIKNYKRDHLKTHLDFPLSSPEWRRSCQFVKSRNKIEMFNVIANCRFSAS